VNHQYHTFILGCILVFMAERGYVQDLPAFKNEKLSHSERITDLLMRLTVEEKVGMLVASAEPIPRLNIDKYYHGNEALHGVVQAGQFYSIPTSHWVGKHLEWTFDASSSNCHFG